MTTVGISSVSDFKTNMFTIVLRVRTVNHPFQTLFFRGNVFRLLKASFCAGSVVATQNWVQGTTRMIVSISSGRCGSAGSMILRDMVYDSDAPNVDNTKLTTAYGNMKHDPRSVLP